MGKHRPIEDRIAAVQAQMASLQAKANKEEVNNDPRIQEIDGKINDLNKTALKWKRWAKDAEQKVQDFQNRVTEWEKRGEKSEEWMSQYREDLAELKSERNLTANEIAKGM